MHGEAGGGELRHNPLLDGSAGFERKDEFGAMRCSTRFDGMPGGSCKRHWTWCTSLVGSRSI